MKRRTDDYICDQMKNINISIGYNSRTSSKSVEDKPIQTILISRNDKLINNKRSISYIVEFDEKNYQEKRLKYYNDMQTLDMNNVEAFDTVSLKYECKYFITKCLIKISAFGNHILRWHTTKLRIHHIHESDIFIINAHDMNAELKFKDNVWHSDNIAIYKDSSFDIYYKDKICLLKSEFERICKELASINYPSNI